MKTLRLILFVSIALTMFSCNENSPTSNMNGEITKISDCLLKNGLSTKAPSTMSCVLYDFDGTLHITHQNAAFNCCPGDITAVFQLQADTIYIYEFESDALCDCNCLYDIEFEINDLPAGNYVISLVEPYISEENEKLIFPVDLNSTPSGSECVNRTSYPYY